MSRFDKNYASLVIPMVYRGRLEVVFGILTGYLRVLCPFFPKKPRGELKSTCDLWGLQIFGVKSEDEVWVMLPITFH